MIKNETISQRRKKFKTVPSPIGHEIAITYIIPILLFLSLGFLVFSDDYFLKFGVPALIFAVTCLVALSEHLMNDVIDHDLNSPNLQLCFAWTGALALGISLGYDPEQMYESFPQYFAAISVFLIGASIAAVADNIKPSIVLRKSTNPRAKKIYRMIFLWRTRFFIALFFSYVLIPLAAPPFIVLFAKIIIHHWKRKYG